MSSSFDALGQEEAIRGCVLDLDADVVGREVKVEKIVPISEEPATPTPGLVLSQITQDDKPSRGIKGLYFTRLNQLSSWERTETGLTARVDDFAVSLDLLDSDLFRIQIFAIGIENLPPTFSVIREKSTWKSEFLVEETTAEIQLVTPEMRVVVGKSPFKIEAFRTDGSAILECPDNQLGSFATLNDEFVVTRKRSETSTVLGLGQKTGDFDRSGRSLVLWNTDVLNPRTVKQVAAEFPEGDLRGDPRSQEFDPYYISIPFYQTLDEEGRASGFFIDNLNRAEFDFTPEGETRIGFSGGAYVEYVFAGPSLPRVVESYTELTGRIQAPPIWSLGYHHCRWYPYTANKVLQHAHTYRSRQIPCDSFWLDIDHMNGYRVFTWNDKLFPDPVSTFASLKEQGFRAVTIVDPGVKVEPGYPVYETGLEKNAFCLTKQGAIYQGQVWPGRTAFPDFVSEEARDWWGDLNAKHLQLGLSGIWNDMNEPATGDIPEDAMRFGGGKYSHGDYHNSYALLMAMATHKGFRKALPKLRPFILSRAGSAGIQRYAANWLGDNMSRWEHLAMSIPMSLGLGLSGQPFVGADIGGFGENSEPELLVRWFQAASLSPFCRNHNDAEGVDQYPWSFGPEVERLCKAALDLRYRLLPYMYTAFIRATQDGTPVMRAMAFHDQSDPHLRGSDDQYLLGPDLLVAPIVEKGSTSRKVKLPKGEWFDWWSNASHQTREHSADAPLDKIPVYARAGSVIAMWPEAPPSTMDYHPERIELHVFVPSKDGVTTSNLVEDDGTSFDYESGERLTTRFTLTRKGNELTLEAKTEGHAYAGFQRNVFDIRLRGAADAQAHVSASTDGFVWSTNL
jgi:alpha-glucosidase